MQYWAFVKTYRREINKGNKFKKKNKCNNYGKAKQKSYTPTTSFRCASKIKRNKQKQ